MVTVFFTNFSFFDILESHTCEVYKFVAKKVKKFGPKNSC